MAKLLATILLTLTFSFLALPAQADVLQSAGKFTSCTAVGITGGLGGTFLSGKINSGLQKIAKKFPKLAGVLNALSSVPVADGGLHSKEFIQDAIFRCAAREILSKMSSNVLQVARTGGRDGGLVWIRNWRNFQLQSQQRGERVFRNMLASAKSCDYFENDLKNLFGVKQKKSLPRIETRTGDFDSFASRIGCTLPKNFDIGKYKQDFSGNGGWEAWSRMLEPQNNFYGALFQSLDEANRQRAVEETADINQAIANDGFIGKSGNSKADSCLQTDDAGQCIAYKDIKTPGRIIASGVEATIHSEFGWINNADELNEIIASAIQVLLNRLSDLSNPNEGDYLIPGEIDVELPEPTSEPGPGGGGGGMCADTGTGVANYAGAVQTAINSVISENPGGIADQLNTIPNSRTFLNLVADKLKASGYKATTNVLNGNGNPNTGDLIAVWRSGDTVVERYDAISGVGDADKPIRIAGASADFKGDIPLSCASESGATPPTAQEYRLSHSFVGERDVFIRAEVGTDRTFNSSSGEKIEIYVNDVLKMTCVYTPCIYAETNYADGEYVYRAVYTRTNGERLYTASNNFVVPASATQPPPIASADGTLKATVSGTSVTLEYTTNSQITFAYIERRDGASPFGWVGIAQLQGDGLPSGTITDEPLLSPFGQTNHTYRLMTMGPETDIELARVTVLIISE